MKVFITGGTSGIGLALAQRYRSQGDEVAVFALPGPSPVDGLEIRRYTGDVRDRESLKCAVADFAEGRLDLMIAAAGINHGYALRQWPDFDLEKRIIEVNLLGVVHAFEAATAAMAPHRAGHLVAIASASGLVGVPGSAGYTASKAAVITLCEALAIDLSRLGLVVSCFAPGFVETPLTEDNPDPMPFKMSAAAAALRIHEAIAAGAEFVVFPWQVRGIFTVLRLLPRPIYRWLFRRAYARRMARLALAGSLAQ